MLVLVTGGTGFVGRQIVRELHGAGHGILLLSRHPHAGGSSAQEQFQARPGNILDAKTLTDACRGADAVIHLVGIISEIGEQTFENVHTRGTQNILAAAKAAGVKRFVHMSALGTRPDAIARYHKSKWAAEELVRGSGLDWTIFRPSIIYGPGDGFVNLFAKMIRLSPVVPIMGGGRNRFQPVAVECVAKAFVRALTEPRSIGKTFDLCGVETFSFDEIMDSVLAVMKRHRVKLHVPLAIARLQAATLEFIFPRLLRKPPPLNRDQLLMLQEDNVGHGREADELLELKAPPFREGIARYLR